MTVLLDGNVLVALCTPDHIHHELARTWWSSHDDHIATTPITQGTVLRFLIRSGLGSADAVAVVTAISSHDRHVFWPDHLPYTADVLRGVIGHRQVTDSYLAALARANSGRLATLDRGLAALHPDIADLIPS